MSAILYVRDTAMPTALSLLPKKMDSAPARALVIAIGLQESRFVHRKQIRGPARGFWQFETAGVKGVLSHDASSPHISKVVLAMGYDETTAVSHEAIANNDILACVYARLLVWTSALPLPKRNAAHDAWNYYISCWRPGKPHPETWDAFYAQAWELVEP